MVQDELEILAARHIRAQKRFADALLDYNNIQSRQGSEWSDDDARDEAMRQALAEVVDSGDDYVLTIDKWQVAASGRVPEEIRQRVLSKRAVTVDQLDAARSMLDQLDRG